MSTFGSQIQAIEQGLLNSVTNATQLQVAMNKLQSMDVSLMSAADLEAYNRAIEKVDQLKRALKDASEQGQKNLEALRKRLETVTDRTKKWAEELVKAGGLTGKLTTGLLQTSHAAGELSKSGDIGRFIQQMTSGIPIVAQMGFVIGETVSATIKARDALKVINKTFIDAAGSVGKFAQGMGVAASSSESLGQGLAVYEQQTGLTRDQTLGLITALSKAGFAMDEMGVDEKTGEIKTFEEAVSGLSDSFGALSSTVAMARSTGMDMSQVTEQMAFQTKFLGQTVEQTTKTFAGLQVASERSKLSTQILLPIVRSIQEQYKFLGIRSDNAALSVGRMAQAASKAGLGPQAGAQLFGRAMGGLVGAGFGTQAFLGMQMGMGGGLGAGFRFRREAGESGAKTAVGVAGAVQNLIGGRFVSQEDAMKPGNEILAGIRVGQEQLVMQLTGLSQLEASGFLDTAQELKKLEATGKGDSDQAKAARKTLEAQMMSENKYRAQTLTAQQKMAMLMEVLAKTAGKILISFVKGFAGEAAGGAEGAFKEIFEAMESGETFDVLSDKVVKLTKTLDKDLSPGAYKLGQSFGTTLSVLGGPNGLLSVLTTLTAGGFAVKILSLRTELVGLEKGAKGAMGALGKTGLAGAALVAAGVLGWELGKALAESDLFGILDKPLSQVIGGWIASIYYGTDAINELAKAHQQAALATLKETERYAAITKLTTPESITEVETAIQSPKGLSALYDKYETHIADAIIQQAATAMQGKAAGQDVAARELEGKVREANIRVKYAEYDPESGIRSPQSIINTAARAAGELEAQLDRTRAEAKNQREMAQRILAEKLEREKSRTLRKSRDIFVGGPGSIRDRATQAIEQSGQQFRGLGQEGVTAPAAPQSVEVNINVKGDGVLKDAIDERINVGIENGKVQAGKEGSSSERITTPPWKR